VTRESLDNLSRNELSASNHVIEENNLPKDINQWSDADIKIFSREISKLSLLSEFDQDKLTG